MRALSVSLPLGLAASGLAKSIQNAAAAAAAKLTNSASWLPFSLALFALLVVVVVVAFATCKFTGRPKGRPTNVVIEYYF